jgi:hypothetical protein
MSADQANAIYNAMGRLISEASYLQTAEGYGHLADDPEFLAQTRAEEVAY